MAKLSPSPEGLAPPTISPARTPIPQRCLSAVGAAHLQINLHQYSVEKHFQDEPAELQIPFDFAQGRLSASLRRTSRANSLKSMRDFGVMFMRFGGPQAHATTRDDKGKVGASVEIGCWMTEQQALDFAALRSG
jgi:hypothetical protein